MAVTDEGLLAGIAAGDPQTATAFVRRFQARVFGLALIMVGFRPCCGAVGTWLLTVTRNAAIDVVRARHGIHTHPTTWSPRWLDGRLLGRRVVLRADPRRPPPPVERLRRRMEVNGD